MLNSWIYTSIAIFYDCLMLHDISNKQEYFPWLVIGIVVQKPWTILLLFQKVKKKVKKKNWGVHYFSYFAKTSTYLTSPLRLSTVNVAQVLLYCLLGRPFLLWLLGSDFTSCKSCIISIFLCCTMACVCTKNSKKSRKCSIAQEGGFNNFKTVLEKARKLKPQHKYG